MLDSILIVIVLYKTKIEESLTFVSIKRQLSNDPLNLFIYDNSPDVQQVNSSDKLNIMYVHDPLNSGISRAYNVAAEYAKNNNKKYLLLLDQDSKLPVNFLSVAEASLLSNNTIKLFAPILMQGSLILSPCRFRFSKGSSLSNVDSGVQSLAQLSAFNSGLLIELDAFYEVGGYNEEIKLDFSDHYFISQFKKHYHYMMVMPVRVEHELSSYTNDEHKILSRFKQYCAGIRIYGKIEHHEFFCFFWTLLRTVKLFVIFRNFRFLEVFKNAYLSKSLK